MGSGAAVSLPLRAQIEADRSRREGSAVRVRHDRLGVVVGEGVIVAGLDDLDGLACGFGLFGSVFVALPPHLVLVPTDVPDELKTLVGDMLGDGGDEVARGENLEPTEGRRPARTCRSERNELQREFAAAVLLVHHARKGSGKGRPGQALCGSSDLHGWGDSNLYLRRKAQGLSFSIEQRAAPSRGNVPLVLVKDRQALAQAVVDERVVAEPQRASAHERVIETLTKSD
jgi:hypothetical protein